MFICNIQIVSRISTWYCKDLFRVFLFSFLSQVNSYAFFVLKSSYSFSLSFLLFNAIFFSHSCTYLCFLTDIIAFLYFFLWLLLLFSTAFVQIPLCIFLFLNATSAPFKCMYLFTKEIFLFNNKTLYLNCTIHFNFVFLCSTLANFVVWA